MLLGPVTSWGLLGVEGKGTGLGLPAFEQVSAVSGPGRCSRPEGLRATGFYMLMWSLDQPGFLVHCRFLHTSGPCSLLRVSPMLSLITYAIILWLQLGELGLQLFNEAVIWCLNNHWPKISDPIMEPNWGLTYTTIGIGNSIPNQKNHVAVVDLCHFYHSH